MAARYFVWLLRTGLAIFFMMVGGAVYGADIHVVATSAPPGGIAALDFQLVNGNDGPSTFIIELRFDTAKMMAVAIDSSSSPLLHIVDFQNTDNGVVVILTGASAPVSTGTFLTLYLEVAEEATSGETIAIVNGSSTAANLGAQALTVNLTADSVPVASLTQPHSADTDGNGRIGLPEVLRVVQLYNGGAYYCDSTSEDGFTIVSGARDCEFHNLDLGPPDWTIDLSELLRCIQFFNALKGAYHPEPSGEDGFAPGPARGN